MMLTDSLMHFQCSFLLLLVLSFTLSLALEKDAITLPQPMSLLEFYWRYLTVESLSSKKTKDLNALFTSNRLAILTFTSLSIMCLMFILSRAASWDSRELSRLELFCQSKKSKVICITSSLPQQTLIST